MPSYRWQHRVSPYVEYWNRLLEELDKSLPATTPSLVEGFWPTHNWNNVRPTLLPEGRVDITSEDDEAEPYCGPLNERPNEAFNPWRDIREGSWVLLRASNLDFYRVWMERALTSICKDIGSESYGKFAIQFWEPKNSSRDSAQKYKDCWSSTWIMEN